MKFEVCKNFNSIGSATHVLLYITVQNVSVVSCMLAGTVVSAFH